MDQASIEGAYAPFVATLRKGGFEIPAEGWPAELVAAHVCRNNDLLSGAAEALAAGGQPTYDNRPAVDEDELARFAALFGDLDGLAEAVESSARRLAGAFAGLSEEAAGYLMPAVIVDGGRLVRDEPVAIGKFIELNASFHLDMHLAQLIALALSETREQATAEPPREFDRYELVLLRRPEGRGALEEETAERLQAQHLGHLEAMRKAGHLKVAGPLAEQGDETWRGIAVYQVGSLEEVRELANQDPAVRAGRLAVEVMNWYIPKGAISFPS